MGWLSGYKYRKSVTLSRASGAVTNYQMKILVGESSGSGTNDVHCNGHCLSTFNDLRFINASGTVLDYWIESISGATPNQVATIWVEFDSIGTGATTFYMYYGNADAEAVSSGVNTFIFWDGFDRADNATVGNDWDESGGANSFSIVSNKLKLTNATSAQIIHAQTPSGQVIAECLARQDVTNKYSQALIWYGAAANRYAGLEFSNDAKIYYLNNTGSFWHDSGVGYTANVDVIFGVRHDVGAGNCDYFVNRSLVAENQTPYTTAFTNKLAFYINSINGSNTLIDWVLVRRSLDTEPAWGSWGNESSWFYLDKTNVWKGVADAKLCIGSVWKSVSTIKICIGNVWKDLTS